MTRADIENAILNTFLSINDTSDDLSHLYKLDENVFTSPFRRSVAKRINEVEDEAYSFLSYQIEESCLNTKYEYEQVELNSQLSLGLKFSKKYYNKLKIDDEVNELC